ncbi:MAG TPA: ATP-binding protein, partial [Anaeromyxobacteraceae bacterium]|nr:ATP-binding protein [Anaeromyxobacteraceae bacterium]
MPADLLTVDRLCRRCPEEGLGFASTAELADLEEGLGQARARTALEFGISLRGRGYHVFVLGPQGSGKRALALEILSRRAAGEHPADDWCYLNNFDDPQKPRALRLPPGRAVPLKRDMDRLLEDLRASIPAVFESEDYRARLSVLQKQLEESRERVVHAVQDKARERKLAVVRTPVGFVVAPVREGEVLDTDQFQKLPEEEQRHIQVDIAAVQEELQAALRNVPQLDREHRQRVKDLNREVALYAVGHLLEDLRRRYADLPQVLAHLDAVRADVLENVHDFLGSSDGEDTASQMRKLLSESPTLRRYRVNVMVDNGGAGGAPVVEEDLPTFANLVGRIEHHVHLGALLTDFTLLRPGALHRANGGYLLLDARRLLLQPFAWEQLKRALSRGQIRLEAPEQIFGLGAGATLEPEPIPLDVKVVLTGEPLLYYLLATHEPEFIEHFKVAAELEDDLPRDGHELEYARLVATLARQAGLKALSRGAVARVIERAARLAGDAERLTTRVELVKDLLREADHAARAAHRDLVLREDVQAALDAQARREGRLREKLLEQIVRGTVLIDTSGTQAGQVNALSFHQLGRFTFGRPSRVTARVRLGRGEVVDIEREVELGGPIHSKGVLILASLLAARYSPDRPFTLSASLVFEQSYGGVEGDSASVAELYALLSALSGAAIRQGIAVTGSVNQLGQVQAIGGANEKIEGFFDVCAERGLTGEQGVIIPAANAKDLMLRPDVVEACGRGAFHVWAIDEVDAGLEILTGVTAGERGADGRFAPGSL